MLEFTDQVIGRIDVPLAITENMVESVLVGAFEGGSNYWVGVNNTGEIWERKPQGEPLATWATKLVLDGETVELYDREDEDEVFHLTLEGIMNGFKLNAINRPWDSDIEEGDATTADCILQYALFGKIVFG